MLGYLKLLRARIIVHIMWWYLLLASPQYSELGSTSPKPPLSCCGVDLGLCTSSLEWVVVVGCCCTMLASPPTAKWRQIVGGTQCLRRLFACRHGR
mmetsp:Transcript_1048/g.1971  ORF Transcript_1048/g.1971 Transcript_1048/m.1971 type:complete len:96 (+) Transcript_1048:402-689(+)